jgi:hypothetical protein
MHPVIIGDGSNQKINGTVLLYDFDTDPDSDGDSTSLNTGRTLYSPFIHKEES